MKLGILITTYNRSAYLLQCIESIKRADIPEGTKIVIVDDCSTEQATINIIQQSGFDIIIKNKNQGICDSLVVGFNYLFCEGCDTLMNVDGDAICRNDFVQRILELPDRKVIKTGFHCTTKNRDGSERHKIQSQSQDNTWNIKASVGGINMCFRSIFWEQIRQIIIEAQEKRLNWDHQVCLALGGAISVSTSVIQHIGINSSMGHYEQPDIADTFKPLSLPDVTLVCVDDNVSRAATAMNECAKDIAFGAVVSINPMPILGSKRAYSEYIMHELHKHITTSHMLVVQHDGFVKNWKAWNNEWLQWDYIGAPWEWYKDGMNVGNGGASLRSKKLMEIAATLPLLTDKDDNGNYAEDHSICRLHRSYLESQGIRFAPLEVARKFSIEAYGLPLHLRRYNGQFCFHSKNVIF